MFGNFFKIFKSAKNFIGVDVGTLNVKIVEMKLAGKTPLLKNYGSFSIPYSKDRYFKSFDGGGLLLSDHDLAKSIKEICEEAKIQTKDAIFSIPDFASFFTTLQLPIMGKDEISEAIKYEIRPYIPVPLSEITLDWVITDGEPGKTPTKILAVAIPNGIISQYKEIAKISELNLKMVEPEVFALVRSLRFSVKAEPGKNVLALVDIGARSTTCSILDQGILKTSNSFNIGSGKFAESLSRNLNIDYNKAEEALIKNGIILNSQDRANQYAFSSLLSSVDSLIDEIDRSMRSFFQTEGKDVNKIILTGGVALMPGLKDYIFQKLKKEAVIGNPFVNVSFNPILAETLKEIGPSFGIAIGLAMKGIE